MQANINVKVTEDVKKRLDILKTHPRQPYWEVIVKLLDFMDQQPLTSIEKEGGNNRC